MLSLKIDWYAGTADYSTAPNIWFGEVLPDWRMLRGRQGYARREQELYTGIEFMYHPERKDMGAHIELSGKVIDRFLSCHPWLAPVDCFAKSGITSYKPTRIDIAIDIPDVGAYARKVYNRLAANPARVGRRKLHLHQSIGVGGGKSVDIGARTSPLFLRIYDKDGESKGRVPVSRVEFELKAYAAQAVHNSLWRQGLTLSQVAGSLLLRVGFDWRHEELSRLLIGTDVIEWTSRPETETSTQDWLRRQVLPTLVQDGLTVGYPLLLDWLYELTWERLKTSLPPSDLDEGI